MKPLRLWRHEVARAGVLAWLAPATGLALAIGGAVVCVAGRAPAGQARQVLLTGLEALLPLAVANVAVVLAARDPFREAQLAMPTGYHTTVLRRLAVLGGFGAVLAVAFTVGVWAGGGWSGPDPLASPLVWAPPLLWLTGFALLVGLLGRSVALATGLVGGVWLTEEIFAPVLLGNGWARPWLLFFTSRAGAGDGWLENRITLAACGALFVGVAVVLLRSGERLLTEEEV